MTIFTVETGGVLGAGTSYPLPSGSTNPWSVTFSPDGKYLAVADEGSGITIFTVGAGGALSKGASYDLPYGSSTPFGVAFSPNGKYLASVNEDRECDSILPAKQGVY